MNITLDEIQNFIAVVDTGSITSAAQQLDQTVSAASRTLGRLEQKLNTTLLRRTTRRLELTDEGEVFSSAPVTSWPRWKVPRSRWPRAAPGLPGGFVSMPHRRSCCTWWCR